MPFIVHRTASLSRPFHAAGLWRLRWILAVGWLILFLSPGLARPVLGQARTITVNRADDIAPRGFAVTCRQPASDDCTLREAILQTNANPGSVIVFSPSLDGTPIILSRIDPTGAAEEDAAATGDLDLNASVTITGRGPDLTILQAAQDAAFTGSIQNRVLSINDSGNYPNLMVTLSGLTVRYGSSPNPGGGIYVVNRGFSNAITLTDVVVEGNRSEARGGGMDIGSYGHVLGTVRLQRVIFRNNVTLGGASPANGGGLSVMSSQPSLWVEDSRFTGNSAGGRASRGGAIAFYGAEGGNLKIERTRIDENESGGIGGGVFINVRRAATEVFIGPGTRIENNHSGMHPGGASGGGGLAIVGNAITQTPILISKITLTGNEESAVAANHMGGGGIYIDQASVQLEYSRVTGNRSFAAGTGAGLYKTRLGGTIVAANNWWGCSSGPSAPPCDTAVLASGAAGSLVTAPYLQVRASASPADIVTNQTSQITAGMGVNSAGQDVSAHLEAMDGVAVTWSAQGGSLVDAQAVLSTGTAAATYQAAAADAGNQAGAQVDQDPPGPLPRPYVTAIRVRPAQTTLRILSDRPDPSETLAPFTVTFRLDAEAGGAPTTPGGTVTVGDGVNTCTATLPQTSCRLALSRLGSRTLTASYSGDPNFAASVSPGEPHLVTNTHIDIDTDLSIPTVTGESLPVAFRLTPVVPDDPNPFTGTVTISAGPGIRCTAVLPASSCALTFPTARAYTLTVSYSGDGHFQPSQASGWRHTVLRAGTTTQVLSTTPSPSIAGDPVEVRFAVRVAAPGAGAPAGTVTVSDGEVSCTAALPASACSLTPVSYGPREFTATYGGEANFQGSTSPGWPHDVLQRTTLTITPPQSSETGQPIRVAFRLDAAGTDDPTGTVTISSSAGLSCAATLPETGCTLAFPSAGAYTLTAAYGGDARFLPAVSPAITHSVRPAPSTILIRSRAPSASRAGQPVTVEVSVSAAAPGAGTPTGGVTVTAEEGGSRYHCAMTLPATTCSLVLPRAGQYTLTASYAGDSDFLASQSSGEGHTVGAGGSTTVIEVVNSPSVAGEAVRVQFQIGSEFPGAVAPTGSVIVSADEASCITSVSTGGCNLTFMNVGTKTITAGYLGDRSHLESRSAPVEVQVSKALTLVTLAGPNGGISEMGKAARFQVAVRAQPPGSGAPTGSVIISDGTQSCRVQLPGTSCTLTWPDPGSVTLTAVYAGSANFEESVSAPLAHRVVDHRAVVSVQLPPSSVVGEALRVGVNVSPLDPANPYQPTGTVIVSAGAGLTCTLTLPETACTLSFPAAGAYTLSASYTGSAHFLPAEQTGLAHTVRAAETALAIVSVAPQPSRAGQEVTVTFLLGVVAPGGGLPDGSVTVTATKEASVITCSAPAAAGTCKLVFPATGTYTIQAGYAGSANYRAGTSTAMPHVVNQTGKAGTRTAILARTPISPVAGQPVTVFYQVASDLAGTPGGQVTVMDGQGVTCTASAAGGQCTLAFPAAGARELRAVYSGDSRYDASTSAPIRVEVMPAVTQTKITVVEPLSPMAGQPARVTFQVQPVPPAGGQPTGTVTVSAGQGITCTAEAAVGQCTLTFPAPGTYVVRAEYPGDAGYLASASSEKRIDVFDTQSRLWLPVAFR